MAGRRIDFSEVINRDVSAAVNKAAATAAQRTAVTLFQGKRPCRTAKRGIMTAAIKRSFENMSNRTRRTYRGLLLVFLCLRYVVSTANNWNAQKSIVRIAASR